MDAAAGEATGIAKTARAASSAATSARSGGAADATMELRVPAEKFAAVVDQLAELGTEEQRGRSAPRTSPSRPVDLDARITVQQARVDSGRKLLAQAKSLNDLVMLEREVATREADLASLQAKKRGLADLTALSTITVTLLDRRRPPRRRRTGRPASWAAGGRLGRLAGASLAVLLTVLGALLPWLIALACPGSLAVGYLFPPGRATGPGRRVPGARRLHRPGHGLRGRES